VPTLQRAREALLEELSAAFVARDADRVVAAARWLRSTGTPLVELYEVVLATAGSSVPEFASTSSEHVAQHRAREVLCELASRLGSPTRDTPRGSVLVVVPGGSRHLLGTTALVHVLQDDGWSVVSAPELGLDDIETQLTEMGEPAGLCLGLHEASLIPRAREVVRRARARWPRLRVLVGGLAARQVPDLAAAVGATTSSSSLRATLAALDDPVPLSPRELAVLSCVAKGMSNPDAAAHLGVAAATVKTHLDRVYAKLGTSDRTASVAVALRRGWID
jgi:DNA-binding CsgD family transcriptional regulator